MIDQGALLNSAIAEYDSTVNAAPVQFRMNKNRECIVLALCKHHDWTDRGAEAVLRLANEYGAFMLRNALALAVVLGKEDGDLDF